MDDTVSQTFDLQILLKQGNLDIRNIAAKHASMAVDEYFDVLSKFLDDTPTLLDILTQIVNSTGGEQPFQSLETMKSLLTDIGRNKLVSVIDGIVDAGKKGNKELAATCAKKISEDLIELCKQTEAARKKNNTSEDESTDNYLTLKEALEQADDAEENRKLRILAVDDNAFMLKTISSMLSSDYEVFSLTKGTMVERFLQNTTPELILLDYNMPEMDGFELISVIKGIEEHKDTPIIFLTAMGTVDHVKTATSLGACDYIVKPAQAEILKQKIAKHIVRKKAF